MKLLITQLKEGENPFHFDSLQEGWVRDIVRHVEKQGYQVNEPMKVDLNLTKLEPDYYLRGQLEFGVGQSCARCAETFQLAVKHPFTVALAHISNLKARSADLLSEESEELDICFFEGHEIELAPIIQEQFFLSIPYQAVCRPDCKGVCQQCGRNLNDSPCGCKTVNPMNPFNALKNLKI
jgi:uncharacterized protein